MLIILGGTFDPIHNGHLQIASYVADKFNSNITFMPTGIPPYKAKPEVTNLHRLTMLNLAIANYSQFSIDETEISNSKYCYTYQTLKQLREQIGYTTPVYFIIGSDSLISFDTWDNWQEILDYCSLIVVSRVNYNEKNMSSTLQQFVATRIINTINKFKQYPWGKICHLDFTPTNVSSTTIRQKIKDGITVDNLIPQSVYQYIVENELYATI